MKSTSPRRTRAWLSLVGALTALAIVAAACGDDDSSSSSTGADATTEPTAAAEATATEEPTEADGTTISEERCETNRDAGTLTFVTGFDYAAAAGILDAIVAEAEGYFEELCLDVEIQPAFAPANGALVIGGQAQFGSSGSFGELVNNNLAGEGELVGLLHFGRTAIEGLVVPEGSGIESFGDLCGNLVGIKGDLPYSLQAAVGLEGVERDCFDEILLDGFDPVAHLDLGIDALPVYKSNEPYTLDNEGIEYTLLDPLDFDVPSSFAVHFTTQSFLDENPTVVEDFMRAVIRGYEFAAENPDEAVQHAFDLINAAGNPLFFAQETERFRWGVESGIVEELSPVGSGTAIPDLERLGAEIQALTDAGVFDELPDWQSMVSTAIAESLYDGETLRWPS